MGKRYGYLKETLIELDEKEELREPSRLDGHQVGRLNRAPENVMKAWIFAVVIILCLTRAADSTAADVDPDKSGANCEGVQDQPSNMLGAESYTYGKPGTRELRIHILGSPGQGAKRPAIIFFFGGGWRGGNVASFRPQADDFVRQGYIAALADYRVTCRDNSTAVESLADARSAYQWLRRHAAQLGIDTSRMVLSGGSSGGHLALATAINEPADSRPAAIVLFNPAVDLVAVAPAIHLTASQAEAISPSSLSAVGLPPTLIFHGKADHTVPIQTVRTQCARMLLAGSACELVEYVGKAHGFYNSNAYDDLILSTPFDDTTRRAREFLHSLGITGGSGSPQL